MRISTLFAALLQIYPMMSNRARQAVTAALLVAPTAVSANLGEVVTVQGKGEYRPTGQAGWADAKPKQALPDGSFLRTGPLSRMKVYLAKAQAQKEMDANTTWQIREEPAAAGGGTQLDLLKGKTWGQTKQPPSGLSVRTPGGVAAIRGTQWLIEVDDDGITTVTVVDGEVEFGNDAGKVSVGANEVARGEKGKAPTKQRIASAKDRVQWVSSFSVDTRRYPDVVGIAGDISAAEPALKAALAGGNAVAGHYLLAADFALYNGNADAALAALADGQARFAGDARLAARKVDVALFAGRFDDAKRFVDDALKRAPGSLEVQLAAGDWARLNGDYAGALAAYSKAVEIGPKDARGHFGLGRIAAERDDVWTARKHFAAAAAINPALEGLAGERGLLAAHRDSLAEATTEFNRALESAPGDYVSLTGLGLAELKKGNTRAAIETLLKATVAEPRYARGWQNLAIAYYQDGRRDAALAALKKASDADPNDPLPYQLASAMLTDMRRPGEAVAQSQEAMKRLPFLKSVNQLANDQKGSINLGNALAEFGLENWARAYAYDSYNPFWAGSHFFLVDRQTSRFSRNSYLLRGFLTDPTSFGASNVRQPLVASATVGGALSGQFERAKDDRQTQKDRVLRATANALLGENANVALFADIADQQFEVKEQVQPSRSDGQVGALALGARLNESLNLFGYAGRLRTENRSDAPVFNGVKLDIEGTVKYAIGGIRFVPLHRMALMVTGLRGEEDQAFSNLTRATLSGGTRIQVGSESNAQPKYGAFEAVLFWQTSDATTLTASASRQTREGPSVFRQDVNAAIFPARAAFQQVDSASDGESTTFTVGVKHQIGRGFVEARLARSAYDFAGRYSVFDSRAPNTIVRLSESTDVRSTDASVGGVVRLADALALRAAYQQWRRPDGFATTSDISVAGLPVQTQNVLAGGRTQQSEIQLEWAATPQVFVKAYWRRQEIENLFGDVGGLINRRVDQIDYAQLRAPTVGRLVSIETNEGSDFFLQGRLTQTGLAAEWLVNSQVSLAAEFQRASSANETPIGKADFAGTDLRGRPLPFVAREAYALGSRWYAPAGLVFGVGAVHRSKQYRTVDAKEDPPERTPGLTRFTVDPGWFGELQAMWVSANKRWSIDGRVLDFAEKLGARRYKVELVARF